MIAAGEQWPTGGLRPCLEDALGAGAIVAAMQRTSSPEARAAAAAFSAATLSSRPRLTSATASPTSSTGAGPRRHRVGSPRPFAILAKRGSSSVVERLLAKEEVASSTLVFRSKPSHAAHP